MPVLRAWALPGFAAALLLWAAGDSGLPRRLAAEALAGPVSATVERVLDGDTIEVRARIWLGQTLIVRVRIEGIDAPELEARCDMERRLALSARAYLFQRLVGAEVTMTGVVYDKYGGRVRAHIADAQGDIGKALLMAGLVRPYHGERRQSWCDAA